MVGWLAGWLARWLAGRMPGWIYWCVISLVCLSVCLSDREFALAFFQCFSSFCQPSLPIVYAYGISLNFPIFLNIPPLVEWIDFEHRL